MIILCQVIFRGISGRISMTHRPYRLVRCAPTLKHHPISMSLRKQGFVSPCKTTLANSRLLPIAKADGFYGLSDKEFLDNGKAKLQADLARILGVSRAKVNQMLKLLKLYVEIREFILWPSFTREDQKGLAPKNRYGKRQRNC